MELLYSCRPKELDNFIFQNLQPNKEFNQQVRSAIKKICEFLKCNCFSDTPPPRPKVLKIVKGGSSGKGTALKGGSDADLVLFLDVFNGYEDQERIMKSIIQEIEKRLKECLGTIRRDIEVWIEKPKKDNRRALSFRLRSGDFTEYIDFDVLPAFDALGHYLGGMPDPQVYIRLINSSNGRGGQFSPCFTELQKDFIRDRPTKLKSLIRLVKYWYKQLPYWESKPPKYALELLAVYAWEQDGGKTDFNMAEGFRTVLWLIQQHKDLCIFWTKYYDFQNETLKQYLHTQLRKPRPVILDPADPTGIVGEGKRWDLLAQQANDCARQACFRNLDGSMVQPWDVPVSSTMELLYSCRPKELDNFIFQNLQPNREFNEQVRSAIDIICDFLKRTCFRDAPPPQPKVLKIVKGGSSGKGTALKGGSDADLVLFLNIFHGYEDQETNRKFIILEIRRRLQECLIQSDIEVQIETSKWDNPRVLSFRLRSSDFTEEYIDFDVLPAFDALGHYWGGMPDPQVYIRLIDSSNGRGGQFSPCFTELQKYFIRDRPTKLKSLIRLVKFWYKQLPKFESKPPKYALELLAVYAWEQDGRKTDFNMAEGFRTVLWLIQQHKDLCIFWTKYYDFQNETLKRYLHTQLRKPRPVILDPADPTGIVGEGKRWDLLAQQANDCARQACFRNLDGSMVQPWDVPLQVPWEEPYSCAIL